MQRYLPKYLKEYLALIALFFIGLLVLWARNTDPFLNPIIYTEDGAWLGLAFTKGWSFTFLNAKDGYLVLGNLLLLWVAETGSRVFCDDSLVCLPQSIGFFSLVFYSGLATFSFAATRDVASRMARLLLFAFLLLMPLGDSSNEILGRLSNVGYMFVLLSILLVSYRESSKSSTGVYVADVLLIVSAATNPVVILLVAVYLTWRLYQSRGRDWRQDIFLFTGVCLVGLAVAYRILSQNHSEVTGVLQPENLIEVGIARAILYPFIFPYYKDLTNFSTATIFCAWGTFVVFAFLKSSGRSRVFMSYSAVSLIIFWGLTLVMRPSLTQQLGGYDHTFPDRYFMGINAIVLLITMVSASSLLEDSKQAIKSTVLVLLVALVIVYVKNLPWIFESPKTRMPLMTGLSFPDQLCASGKSLRTNEGPPVVVPTYFSGWHIMIPPQLLQASTEKLDCQALTPLNISDQNWNHGVARKWSGVVLASFKSTPLLKSGKALLFVDGSTRTISKVELTGGYLNIFLDGAPLDGAMVGYPNKFAVIE